MKALQIFEIIEIPVKSLITRILNFFSRYVLPAFEVLGVQEQFFCTDDPCSLLRVATLFGISAGCENRTAPTSLECMPMIIIYILFYKFGIEGRISFYLEKNPVSTIKATKWTANCQITVGISSFIFLMVIESNTLHITLLYYIFFLVVWFIKNNYITLTAWLPAAPEPLAAVTVEPPKSANLIFEQMEKYEKWNWFFLKSNIIS